MPKIDLGHYPLRQEYVAYRMVSDELVLLNLDSGVYYSTGDVGAMVWEMSDGNRTVGSIIQAVCAAYEIAEEDAARDIKEYLGDLLQEDLIILNDHAT